MPRQHVQHAAYYIHDSQDSYECDLNVFEDDIVLLCQRIDTWMELGVK